jgi:tRNA(fMet)-specific endonuclease VapC
VTLYLLDTNVASAALKGSASVDSRLAELPPDGWCISAVTRAELRYGVARRPQATRLAQVVEAFLAVARTEPWDERAADVHGLVRAALASRERGIGVFDGMIAAHALALGATLVTDNVRPFGRIPDLATENWLR